MRKTGIILILLCLSAGSIFADSSIKGTQIETVVREISKRQAKITTIQADFRQEKSLSMLAEPEISSGTFVFARPNKVRWNYQQPRPVTMLIADGWMTTYYPSLKKAEKLEVRGVQDRIFRYMGAAAGAIDDLSSYFDFRFVDAKASPTYTLELEPKTKMLARRVQRIKIWIDKTSYLTTGVEYVEGNGDTTHYEFSNIRVNEPVEDGRFQLDLPPGVRIEKMDLNR